MTYADYLRYGHISMLSLLTSGPSSAQTKAMDTNSVISQEQLRLAETQNTQSQADRARAMDLEQPLIDKEKALATGDRKSALEAAMPVISQISSGYTAAKQSVFNSLPPGAARDTALANLDVQSKVAPASAMASSVAAAPEILANVGQGVGAFSLQELGASLSGYGGAASTNESNLQSANAQQAAKLGVVGDVVGAAGGLGAAAIPKKSDIRLKKNVYPLGDVLAMLSTITPVRFEYKSGGPTEVGVIAQEIATHFPEVISHSGDGMMSVDYAQLCAISLQAAKDLHGMVVDLSSRIEELERSRKAQAVA